MTDYLKELEEEKYLRENEGGYTWYTGSDDWDRLFYYIFVEEIPIKRYGWNSFEYHILYKLIQADEEPEPGGVPGGADEVFTHNEPYPNKAWNGYDIWAVYALFHTLEKAVEFAKEFSKDFVFYIEKHNDEPLDISDYKNPKIIYGGLNEN